MTRRSFLAAAAAAAPLAAQSGPIPIIDTHIHLFDTERPEGVPWPPKDDKIRYKQALPERYRRVTKSLNVVGAIEVEASPWLEDNQWVLDVAEKDTIVVGTVGNLDPGKEGFRENLERFHKNPLFRGIRHSYLWGDNLREDLGRPRVIADLKHMAQEDLVLDTANPSIELLEDVVRLSDAVPNLRIILDHLPNLKMPTEAPAKAAHAAAMREVSARDKIFVKLSAVLQRRGDAISYDIETYRPRLDELYAAFGPDRVLYGSDWPNSDPLGEYPRVLGIVKDYFQGKTREEREKYFWRNSAKVYKWVKRADNQPDPASA